MNHSETPESSDFKLATLNVFASEIFNRYSMRLLQLAKDRLGKDIRSKISPEDVVQSAFKSFFRGMKESPGTSGRADDLWGLLSIITIRKCKKWDAFYRCDKRAVSREIADDEVTNRSVTIKSEPSADPGPDDAMVVTELMDWLFNQFDARQMEMLLYRIEGVSVVEIANLCQSSSRTVARTIATAKQMLSEYMLEE